MIAVYTDSLVPEANPEEPFFLGCKSPHHGGSLSIATDLLDIHSISALPSPSNVPLPSLQHDGASHLIPDKMLGPPTAASSTSSMSYAFSPLFPPSLSSSTVSTPSLPTTTEIDFCQLLKLSTTLHEYCCRLMSVQEAKMDSATNFLPTIDQILTITQSLSEMISPVLPTSSDLDPNKAFRPQSVTSYPPTEIDSPSHVPCRSPLDGATALLILSCYLRLLRLYNAGVSKPSAVVATSIPGTAEDENEMQHLSFQIGCFSTPMASSMILLACLISQTLGNFETTLKKLAFNMSISRQLGTGEGDQSWPWEPDAGPGSSVMAITQAVLSEMRILQANLRQQLQATNSVCD